MEIVLIVSAVCKDFFHDKDSFTFSTTVSKLTDVKIPETIEVPMTTNIDTSGK